MKTQALRFPFTSVAVVFAVIVLLSAFVAKSISYRCRSGSSIASSMMKSMT